MHVTAAHLAGDFNGDGLTDVVVREGRALTVLLQCSTDMVGTTAGSAARYPWYSCTARCTRQAARSLK